MFDLVVDCIGYDAEDAEQDLGVFKGRCRRLVFVSTDSVYDPAVRTIPQDEREAGYVTEGYGGGKRSAELVFEGGGGSLGSSPAGDGARRPDPAWTILRPCHIYGPGSLPGCIPRHARDPELIARMEREEVLELVGGGRSLQQPLYVDDLADVVLSCGSNERSIGQILNVAGPSTIECRHYFAIIAQALGRKLRTIEISFEDFWNSEPRFRSYLCHRVVSMERLRSCGLPVPATTPETGIPLHVRALQ